MILKTFEIKKTTILKKKYFLLYGNNKGLIDETIDFLKEKYDKNISYYEENEIINNFDNFKENLLNKSFFDYKKLIIIKRVSDKMYKLIEEIISRDIEDISIILISKNLEKKSKIRIFFEKNNKTICIPFYEDNIQTLSLIANNFVKEKKINISQQNLNLIIDRARGDRIHLKNELTKVELLLKTQKTINTEQILKLSNLSNDYELSELVDCTLSKNKKKLVKILNENNFSSEDCILISKILLSKLKRILKLLNIYNKNKNIEETINQFRPIIFWKDKEIVKQQINTWSEQKIKLLIVKTNDIELLNKKNPFLAVISTTNFLLGAASN